MLIDLLGWKSFTQDDLGQSICLDCIYDSVMFSVNKGFTWAEVSCVIKLVYEMLKAAECEYAIVFSVTLWNTSTAIINDVLYFDSTVCLYFCMPVSWSVDYGFDLILTLYAIGLLHILCLNHAYCDDNVATIYFFLLCHCTFCLQFKV